MSDDEGVPVGVILDVDVAVAEGVGVAVCVGVSLAVLESDEVPDGE